MTDSEKLDLLLDKVITIEDKVAAIEDKVAVIEDKVAAIEDKVAAIENDVKDIRLTLENEIRVNIQRVAEGHLDLSRNLHDAMKPSNEVEMLAIKVRMIETEIRDIKAKLA